MNISPFYVIETGNPKYYSPFNRLEKVYAANFQLIACKMIAVHATLRDSFFTISNKMVHSVNRKKLQFPSFIRRIHWN